MVEAIASPVAGRKTILLVDDEEMVIDVGEKMLKTMGYDVLLARSGTEAVGIVAEARETQGPETERTDMQLRMENMSIVPDLVILDIVMPGMGGGETYDRLKEIDPCIKVLLASGYSIEDQAQDILGRGCNGFIQKPFNLRQLALKIREIMEQ